MVELIKIKLTLPLIKKCYKKLKLIDKNIFWLKVLL